MSNTSATNRASQSKSYCGMPMNSYLGQMLLPHSLHSRSALGTIGQAVHDHGSSGPSTNRPAPYAGQFGVTPSPPQGSQAKPSTTGQSGYNTRPSGPSAGCSITKIGPSGCAYADQGTTRQTQSSCSTPPAAHYGRSMPSPAHEVECLSAPTKPQKL